MSKINKRDFWISQKEIDSEIKEQEEAFFNRIDEILGQK